jgi:hypothetical protein
MLLGRRCSLGADAARLLRGYPTAVYGLEHLPEGGPFLVVMNHYERPGMGVWWPSLIVSRSLLERLGVASPHWLITNRFYRFRYRGIRFPDRLVGWFLARVAARYGLILVARPRAHAAARSVALRKARRYLDARDPQPVASTPEGEQGGGRKLAHAVPTSGKALAWLSRSTVPVVPVGVYEEPDGRLVARFGPPFTLAWPGLRSARAQQEELTAHVMGAIASQLPPDLRGPYGRPEE